MTQSITSYVLRITQIYSEDGEQERRIKLRHVQTEEEIYLSSLNDVPDFIEAQLRKANLND